VRANILADFDTLIKGERLTGPGAWVEEESAVPETVKDDKQDSAKETLEPVTVHSQVDAFKPIGEKWC
jgi:hypothetical protein